MRVLFVLYYPGYLRYFDSVIHELADRGHEVVAAFSKEGHQDEGLDALPHPSGRVTKASRVPRRRDTWQPLAVLVRRLADYTRYLHPRYDEAEHLRRRHEKFLPRGFGFLRRLPSLDPRIIRALHRLFDVLERAVPSSPELERYVAEHRPDVLVVSPLLADLGHQTDLVKSAQALGVPAVLGVGSWDHLTSKGLLKASPERTIVWNEIQRAEAGEYHYVPAERVVVTGAQPFDRWFGREPTRDRDAFCRRVGLAPERPFVLFLGSTASISAPEAELRFVREWIDALRSSEHPAVREASVLVRPHPYNPGLWADADLSDLGSVAIWPRGGANPVDEENRTDYFDSMYHSTATVGINTSAMIESAIVGRPVLTVRAPEFTDTQAGTVHFHYLLPEHGGFLRVAPSIAEHVRQLGDVLADPQAASAELSRFVSSFVRPQGLDRASTPLVADAIEEACAAGVDGDGARTSAALRRVLRATTLLLALAGENDHRRRAARRELLGAVGLGGRAWASSRRRPRRRKLPAR